MIESFVDARQRHFAAGPVRESRGTARRLPDR